MKKLGGLFWTIFLMSLLCMAIPVGLVALVNINSFSPKIESMTCSHLQQLSLEKSNEVASMIKNQIEITKSVAESSFIQEAVFQGTEQNRVIEYLGSIATNAENLYENFFITKMSQGFADCLGGATLHDVAGEPWYEECVKKGEFLGNNISPVTGKPVYVISYGIYHEGKFVGGLNNSIDLAVMTNNITGSIIDKSTKVLIIDTDGYVIASENSEQILKTNFKEENETTNELLKTALSNNTGVVKFNFDGYDSIGALSKYGTMITLVYMPEYAYKNIAQEVIKKLAVIVLSLEFVIAFLIFYVVYNITKPIKVVTNSISEIANGNADLTKRIDLKAKFEVKELVDSFNKFSEKMQVIVIDIIKSNETLELVGSDLDASTEDTTNSVNRIIKDINGIHDHIENQSNSVQQTAGAVNQIASSIDSLENMIENQTAGVSEASAAIEQMMGNINSVNNSVEKMAKAFNTLMENAHNGAQTQSDVNMRIAEIQTQSETLQEANLAIAAIAEQTNLLAMNAAIEAAHAGESGKGFSVVADEIRKLSETSSEQSKTIGAQLINIQESITSVVNACMNSSVAFDKMTEGISSTDEIVRQIKSAMDEQQEGSKQISIALQSMNNATIEVRTSSREMQEGNSEIREEVTNLENATDLIKNSMDNMTSSARQVTETGIALSEISQKMRDSITEISNQICQFKV